MSMKMMFFAFNRVKSSRFDLQILLTTMFFGTQSYSVSPWDSNLAHDSIHDGLCFYDYDVLVVCRWHAWLVGCPLHTLRAKL